MGLAGCETVQENPKAATGAAIGAVAGAVIGNQISHGRGSYVGAALGALAGGAIGHYMDKQQRELEQQLAQEERKGDVQIQRMPDDSLKLTLASQVSFDFNSAHINPGFADALDRMAEVIKKYDKTVVHIIGHTDSVGSAEYNQRLSERRAKAVADYLISRGVNPARIHTEGRGEREPRASNDTEAGRQLNRRVEIYLKPIVEGQEQKAHEAPQPSSRYY
jgi:outer membrane protein OmpA-like peptidoglycan-associated protein